MQDDQLNTVLLARELEAARHRIAELEEALAECARGVEPDQERAKPVLVMLRENTERLSLALDVGNAGIWECQPALDEVKFDERFHAMLGYAPGALPTRMPDWLDYCHPEDRAAWQSTAFQLGEAGIYEGEYRIRDKDGEWVWVLARGKRIEVVAPGQGQRIIGIAMNITERKRSEKALLESERRFRTLVENASDIIFAIEPGGKFTYVSPNWLEHMREPAAEAIGKSFESYVHPDDVPVIWEFLARSLTTTERLENIAYRALRRDGSIGWQYTRTSVLRDEHGEVIAHMGIARDITETRQQEEERRRLEERLQQAYKMEAIGSLAGGIAHDFNNILSSVLGFAELAKMKLEDKEDIGKELDEVHKAGLRARDLVRQILTFSRQSGIKREPLMVTPLIGEALKFLRASLPVTIEIMQSFSASDSMVVADPTQMHQVVMNLCTNAAHAMKDGGGTLDVRLSRVVLDSASELEQKGLSPGRYLRLSVSDTGCGIPKEIINRIFDPFFTTKECGEGTGMGLSVVHGIVKDMGGSVTVYSRPDRGTTFTVLLPAYEGDEAELRTPAPSVKRGSEMILFVDDEEAVAASGQGILERLGYKVVCATSALEAIEMFAAAPDAFDLVLTDLTMPKMTGLELAERLRELRRDIPVVLCTGLSVGVTPERMREAGVLGMVMKPVLAGELSEAVYRALHPVLG